VKTNQRFLARCLDHAAFANGEATTAFIGQHQDALLEDDEAAAQRAAAVAAVLLLETAAGAQRKPGRRLTHSLPVGQRYELDGKLQQASVSDLGGHRHRVDIGARSHELQIVQLDAHHARLICDEVMDSVSYVRDGSHLHFAQRGVAYEVRDTTRAASARADSGGASDGKLRASMNGRVVAVLVQAGQRVEIGQPIVTLEAMKMEHIHAAPLAGIVRILHVSVGEQVPASRIVAEIEGDVAPAA
jgi:geranyl-CoA carboxylase alpha subunit